VTAAAQRSTRIALALAAVTSIAAAVLVAGPGYEPARVRMHSGAVWLASNLTGDVSLVDGATGEVRAHARVAEPGTALTVAQLGGAAFVGNSRTGELSRVDSATERVTPAGADLPANGALVVKPAPDVVHGVDVHSGTVVAVDPDTMRSSGERTRLAERLEPDSVVVDDLGRLWAIDAETGDLVWLAGGERRSRPAGARAGRLTIAEGRPVLVDPQRDTAELLHPGTGVVAATVRPGLSAADVVAVSGSADRSRVLIANAGRGELVTCAFDTRSCADPVKIGAPGAELGSPVEVDDHAVVPDHSTGQATIVDLATGRVVAQRRLFDRPTRFELVVRDGIVFFNDPDSDKAGILDLSGEIRTITKYTEEPAKGDEKPDSRAQPDPVTKVVQPEQKPSVPDQTVRPGKPGLVPPRPSIVVTPGNRGEVGDEFELTVVAEPAVTATTWRFGDGTSGEGTTVRHSWREQGTFTVEAVATFATGKKAVAKTAVTVDPAGAPPRIDRLTVARPKPVVGESVHFSADASGKPDRWAWTVTRAGQPGPEITAQSPEFDHRFTTPGRYTVSLTIARGGKTATSTHQFTVVRGAVKGWGSNLQGAMNIPPSVASGVVAIDAGGGHGVALKADGSVVAWGNNWNGQLEVPAEASSGVVAVSAGEMHTLALKADGTVLGWGGRNSFGQGNVPPSAQRDAVAIAAGHHFSLVLKKDGSLIFWGYDDWGNMPTVPPEAQSGGVIALSGGFSHAMALKADGSVIVWGENNYGETDVPPAARSGVVAIAAEHSMCLALKSDGSLVAWGHPENGLSSIPPAARTGVAAVDTYVGHVVALKTDGTIVAWGHNKWGGTTVPPEYNHGVMAVAAGNGYSLALLEDVE
jgi:hypothetical protein